ncbi:hypothetical protein D8B23_21855 [Verminephrobacter aporrectodeae subsp. tuberculatae]|uniref:Uncharacterized protein n=1 Tax=Verminephrobacter aporrectodeae subsp. tuberculatae TaxID=1110392 RepID=A0ABT3KUA4_9BURK|nr:hypothetical protein [Verminephrobacter aporrectodeae]MCW5321921.1 hypothetical protein [Verminephrobacter aporrectodeae subsp. tuberculatae]MCW8200959.1 hypothetical protein [Verminephrobacter aporrectodeae subsp. tuberculatae]
MFERLNSHSETTYQERSLWGMLTWDRSTTINSTQLLAGQPTQLQSQNDILSNSGGSQLLQGTELRYGGRAVFNGGVGERARADAQIIYQILTNTVTQTRTQDANYYRRLGVMKHNGAPIFHPHPAA